MAVITADILLTNVRRDDAYAWLSDPDNHGRVLDGAFDGFSEKRSGEYELTLDTTPKKRVMGYTFLSADASHAGRRILCQTSGKRTSGKLHWSLRTMKPSTNTMVTMHIDYDPGSLLGALIDSMSLRESLERGMKATLENLDRTIPREG